jgi:RHS repeat-associated protein
MSFADCENAGFYQYDAGGERTYKLTSDYVSQNIGGHWHTYQVLDNPTLYTSPYMVATPKGYTKHYYAESERVASRIGGGLDSVDMFIRNIEEFIDKPMVEISPLWTDDYHEEFFDEKRDHNLDHLYHAMECTENAPSVVYECLIILHKYSDFPHHEYEPDCYWYHPDHLGSSSWITYTDGSSVQHLHYLPWGEDFVNQRSTSWNAMYTFSAKEKDTETGYSYFGARYYSSYLSIWLSVDPMSDKYASTSPYAYCRNNPIILYDPNGMFDDWVMDKNGHIYWDENAKNQETTKQGETYLGKEGQHSIGTRVFNYHGDGTYDEQEPVIINGNGQCDINRSANTSLSQNHNQIDKIDKAISTTSLVTTLPLGAAAESVAKTTSKIALKGLGGIISVATVIPDIVRWRNEPTVENKRKVFVSAGGALISLIPIIGPVGSVIWSSIDAGGGFDRYYKNTNKNKNKNKKK